MNNLYRIIILLLMVSFAACTSTRSNMAVADGDEDKDIGLGGTGMLANTDSGAGSGLGGTGILGAITGFGSVFVNGIEIEYDSETAFTIDGKTAKSQQLEIGDVVEVLTIDDSKHTQAQVINLRHEVIGRVESIEPQTFSFTVQGQSIVQAINKVVMPEVGATVAVSGLRVDEHTILATRITAADAEQSLLRTHTDLPYKGKTTRWLVQTYLRNDKATFKLDGVAHTIELKQKNNTTLSDRLTDSLADSLGIKILKLQKPASGQLELDQVIEPMTLPRGRTTVKPVKQPGNLIMPGARPDSAPRSAPGSMQGPQSGAIHNMKR